MTIVSHGSNIDVLPVLYTLTALVLPEYYSYVKVLTKQNDKSLVFCHTSANFLVTDFSFYARRKSKLAQMLPLFIPGYLSKGPGVA